MPNPAIGTSVRRGDAAKTIFLTSGRWLTLDLRGLLKKKIKGQLSNLMRHYFIADAELGGDFGFGFLEIKMAMNQFSMNGVLTESCEAFGIIHRLNVALWKKSRSRMASKPDK